MTEENRLKIENFVLGSYMQDKDLFDDIESKVSATLFTNHNQNIYSIIFDYYKQGIRPNMVLINNKLNDIGYKNSASLAAALSYDPTIASNITHYIDELWKYKKNNELLTICSDIAIIGDAPLETSTEKLKTFLSDLDYQQNNVGEEASLDKAFDEFEKDLDIVDEEIAIKTGNSEMDKTLGGFVAPRMYGLGARPGMGKTTELIQIIRANYTDPDLIILCFSAEMTAKELILWMASAELSIDNEYLTINKKNLTPHDRQRVKEYKKKVVESSLIIDDTPSPTHQYIGAKARKYRKKFPKKKMLILIDYLQIMGIKPEDARGRSREEQLTTICDALPATGKQVNAAIVLVSQLGREVEKRSPPVPILPDLKGSGSIEANCGVVIFIYRPEYYKIFQNSKGRDMKGLAKFIIAKNRYGARKNIYAQFYGQYCRFSEYKETTEGPDPNQTQIITGNDNGDQPAF